MNELALHVLDIVQNSLRAGATTIRIDIEENLEANYLQICIQDNGKGIEENVLKSITNPFTTTRTLRKVGLGLPLLEQMCKECEGKLYIESEVGEGTRVCAKMKHNHIDRLPLGNMSETLVALIMAKPEVHFIYCYTYQGNTFEIDTQAIEALLDGVPIENLEILAWLKEYINEGEKEVR